MTSPVWALGFEPSIHTDAASRSQGRGKKCGNSYIPASATCNNGNGGASKLRKAAELTAGVSGVAMTAKGYTSALKSLRAGDLRGVSRSTALASAGNALTSGALLSYSKRKGNTEDAKAFRSTLISSTLIGGYALSRSGLNLPKSLPSRGRNMVNNFENRLRRSVPRPSKVRQAAQTWVASVGYRRRSGKPSHIGYLPPGSGVEFDPRGRGQRGTWSRRGS